MSLNIRRVVTGHDDQGRAKVLIDETVGNVVSQRPGALYSVVWSSEGFPVDNDTELDPSRRKIGTTIPNGTVFRIVSFGSGVAPAITAPIRSTMRLSCRARSTWISTVRSCTSRPEMSWCNAGRFTTGSTRAQNLA